MPLLKLCKSHSIMADELFKWFSTHYPTFFLILACCAFAISVTAILSKKYFHWVTRIKNAEGECRKIDDHIVPQLVRINNSIDNLNSSVNNLKISFNTLKGSVSALNGSFNILKGSFNNLVVYLKSKDDKMDASLFLAQSPVELTELGKRVLAAIGGKIFIDNNLHDLLTGMDMQDIKTALDSQIYAPVVISQVSNRSSFNPIKDFAFENPYYKEKDSNGNDTALVRLAMDTIANIMGIYLRDKYLEKHPYLKPGDNISSAT